MTWSVLGFYAQECKHFIAESVYLVVNSLRDGLGASGEMKQRSDIVNFRFLRTEIAESVYLVLNSLWDWEPVERVKQSDMVSFTLFFFSGRSLAVSAYRFSPCFVTYLTFFFLFVVFAI